MDYLRFLVHLMSLSISWFRIGLALVEIPVSCVSIANS